MKAAGIAGSPGKNGNEEGLMTVWNFGQDAARLVKKTSYMEDTV